MDCCNGNTLLSILGLICRGIASHVIRENSNSVTLLVTFLAHHKRFTSSLGAPAAPSSLAGWYTFCGDGGDRPAKLMAEGEGFEPPVRFPAQRFSRPPVSTTHTSLRRAYPLSHSILCSIFGGRYFGCHTFETQTSDALKNAIVNDNHSEAGYDFTQYLSAGKQGPGPGPTGSSGSGNPFGRPNPFQD